MSSQNNNASLEVKMLQRSNELQDLNVILLNAFFLLKFSDDIKNLLGGGESFGGAEVTGFEKDFLNKCFYCGCITEQAGISITHFIIRKASFNDFFRFIKKQQRSKNESERVILGALRAILNGLKPGEHMLVYNGDDNFIELCQSITDDDIMQFVKSFGIFNPFNFLETNKLDKKSDSILDLYEAIKRNIGKNAIVKLYYVIKGDSCPHISDDNHDIILCKKAHRKTYQICSARQFIQTIKNKSKEGDIHFKGFNDIYDFVGL